MAHPGRPTRRGPRLITVTPEKMERPRIRTGESSLEAGILHEYGAPARHSSRLEVQSAGARWSRTPAFSRLAALACPSAVFRSGGLLEMRRSHGGGGDVFYFFLLFVSLRPMCSLDRFAPGPSTTIAVAVEVERW